ncbi:MAG: hypothetical protein R3C00_04740 [Hyphomonas sp.]|nr:hypothetical protein [Hyphomonas sp.]MCB9971289.1 hypothetical protein [Hyphomonas sp.]
MITRHSVTAIARLAFAGAAMALVVACGGPKPKPAEPAAPKADAHVAAAVEAMAGSWNGDIQFVNTFNALDPSHVPSATGGESAVPSLFDPNDEYWGLPRDEGVDYVAGICAGCHSLRLVMQQHRSEARWHELIDWMINTQGMAPLPDDVRKDIETYLGKHFGELDQ